ncbi:DinB family protein [Rhodococcus sp. O3]|uniref:DinB family protein n=1 Tax=Rhodococcus sp. O3 TaxID=3404919 RepID=UPI003B66B0FE
MTDNSRTGERADILDILAEQREMLLITARNLTDEQARTRSTVSDLTVGGLIKHVTATEKTWIETIRNLDDTTTFDMESAMVQYYMNDDETLAGLLDAYADVARETERFVLALDDLDLQVPLPTAPWAPEREWWSARKVLLHIIRETAHHSGHADIIRESLDGANSTLQRGADAGMTFD